MLVKYFDKFIFLQILEYIAKVNIKVEIQDYKHPRGLIVVTFWQKPSSLNIRDKIWSREKENKYKLDHRFL